MRLTWHHPVRKPLGLGKHLLMFVICASGTNFDQLHYQVDKFDWIRLTIPGRTACASSQDLCGGGAGGH